jgi:hypothetical protein
MLLMTLFSVILAIFLAIPILGVLLAIASTMALARTRRLIARQQSRDRPVTSADRIAAFIDSLMTVCTIAVATGGGVIFALLVAALLAMLLNSEVLLVIFLLLSPILAFFIGLAIYQRLWPTST